MSRNHVSHREVAQFATDRVNLPKAKAGEYRAQARRLREKLEAYLDEHPDFTLRKMQLSGSLAKGTALRSLNDIDVACYVSGAEAPTEVEALLDYIAERLRKAFPKLLVRSSAGADLLDHGFIQGKRARRGRCADPLRRRSAVVRQPREPGRRLVAQDQHSASSRVRRKTQEGAGEGFCPGGAPREVLGPTHETRAGGLPVQVVHGGDDSSQAL